MITLVIVLLTYLVEILNNNHMKMCLFFGTPCIFLNGGFLELSLVSKTTCFRPLHVLIIKTSDKLKKVFYLVAVLATRIPLTSAKI